MDLNLSDRVAFVAGSSRGIGKAIAKSFLAEGCRVVVTGRNGKDVTDTVNEFSVRFGKDKATGFVGDLCDTEAIKGAVTDVYQRWGKTQCLVANIGSGKGKAHWTVEDEEWQSLFQTNLWGSVRLIREAIPHISGNGSIVLVSSIAGIEATQAPLPYGAAKAALISYAKNLSRQLGAMRVNVVAPGNILFPGGTWERHLANKQKETENYIKTEVPLKRFGTPEEIADLVVFLSSPRASFITGACVVADGGQTRSC